MDSRLLLPHINLSSYPGGGKTTITKLLLDTYAVSLIPKFTTRPKRPIEEIPEYIFISEKEFFDRHNSGHFIAIEPIKRYGVTHYHAIPKIEHWPQLPNGTEIILSVFGENAPYAKKYVPNMKLCFIDFEDKSILMDRLYARCLLDNSDFEEKRKTIEAYIKSDIRKNYDYIVYNDGTEQETLEQIMDLVKIPA